MVLGTRSKENCRNVFKTVCVTDINAGTRSESMPLNCEEGQNGPKSSLEIAHVRTLSSVTSLGLHANIQRSEWTWYGLIRSSC